MIFERNNSIWSLMKIPFKYSPLLAVITAIQGIVEAIIPAINVIAVAEFVNTAANIFAGKADKSAIYLPLAYIVILLAFRLLFSSVMGYFTRKMHIRLNKRINLECIEKQASLTFEYIDNSESFMLIQRVFGDITKNINTIYNDVLNAVNLAVRFVSIMIIFVANGLWWIGGFINLFSAFAIISFMTYCVLYGKINTGLYIALVTSLILLIDQVIESAMAWANNLAQEKEFLKDLNTVCNFKSNNDVLCRLAANPIPIETIEFRNVTFKYPGTERTVLNNISFKIERGKHYGFVGRNGAGKSTIVKLLRGLYDNYSGGILINGKSLREYSCSDIKTMMGIIYQDYAKYELTLKENIAIGDVNTMSREDNTERIKEK